MFNFHYDFQLNNYTTKNWTVIELKNLKLAHGNHFCLEKSAFNYAKNSSSDITMKIHFIEVIFTTQRGEMVWQIINISH